LNHDPALTRTLLDLDEAAPLSAGAAQRIKQRLLARVAFDADVDAAPPHADDRRWGPLFDGAHYRVLHDDGRTFGWLLRMRAGTRLPQHAHDDGDEECLVLEGSVIAQGTRLRVGDYQVARRHSVHDDVYCDEDCLIYLRSGSARRGVMRQRRRVAESLAGRVAVGAKPG
jgi:quercetin dioxygenase-like cupin family protein